jgi:hypothetical protein
MYERRKQPLASHRHFVRRLIVHGSVALSLMTLSLGVGMLGYQRFEHLSWLDGFLNCAMLLGGMGPVNTPITAPGKLFAGLYALYAGLVFLIVVGLVFTPIVHRFMHRFHIDEEQSSK